MIDIDELERLEKAATPAPWVIYRSSHVRILADAIGVLATITWIGEMKPEIVIYR